MQLHSRRLVTIRVWLIRLLQVDICKGTLSFDNGMVNHEKEYLRHGKIAEQRMIPLTSLDDFAKQNNIEKVIMTSFSPIS